MDSTIVQIASLGWEKISPLIQAALNQWKLLLLLTTFLAYLFLVSLLRFRRAKGLYRRYSHLTKRCVLEDDRQ